MLSGAFLLRILRHNTRASLRAMDDTTHSLDPVRYRYLLDLRATAVELLAGAEADSHPPAQDADSLARIRNLVHSLDRTINQLSRTLSRHSLPR